jgi:glyoxylase-like metal-dependent hydrolase (beta-lactamase superfamily II)
MLSEDPFSYGTPISNANIQVVGDEKFDLNGIKFQFHHFPGHTPGCSAISIEDNLFSGDFIFNGSIGRVDFPYSNPSDMTNSINRVLAWTKDFEIYPGHGDKTTLTNEKDSLKNWLKYL